MSQPYASRFFVSLGTKLPKRFSNALRRISEQTELGFRYQQFGSAKVVSERFELLKIGSEFLRGDYVYLEFGVAWGDSINRMLEYTRLQDLVEIHGFDTFNGLPEPHHGEITEGSFDQYGVVPDISGVIFHKGLFMESFLGNEDFLQRRLFVMLDADLFSSTSYVLSRVYPFLKVDDLIYFDDLHVPNQERLAFDLSRRKGLKVEIIARSSEGRSALFKVT